MRINRFINFNLLILFVVLSACKTEKEILREPLKEFTGKWRISKIIRNEEDITPTVDSAGFRLTLYMDNTFIIENNNVPFVANGNGAWSLNDPAYPFHISFKNKDSSKAGLGDLSTPVINGRRNMVITFSPGCYSNKYIYTLESIQ